MNRIQFIRTDSNTEVLKRDYSTAQVKEKQESKNNQWALVKASQYEQHKIKCLQKSPSRSL